MRTIGDDRGVSESTGVAVLILITIITTASVGLSVIIADSESGSDFDVRFQYSSDLAQITLFYEGEKEVKAGDILIVGPANNVTWAELADVEDDATVAPGDRPVFLNEASPYGSDVSEGDNIRVIYDPDDGKTVTRTWTQTTPEEGGGSEGGGETPGNGGPETAIHTLPPAPIGTHSR